MRITKVIVVALMLLASNLLAADFVELKDVSGKHTIKVEINKVTDGKVQVTDEKGKTAEYSLSVFDRDSLILILNVVAKMKDIPKPIILEPPMRDDMAQDEANRKALKTLKLFYDFEVKTPENQIDGTLHVSFNDNNPPDFLKLLLDLSNPASVTDLTIKTSKHEKKITQTHIAYLNLLSGVEVLDISGTSKTINATDEQSTKDLWNAELFGFMTFPKVEKLELRYLSVNDDFVRNLSKQFPNLKVFEYETHSVKDKDFKEPYQQDGIDVGFKELKKLKSLTMLGIKQKQLSEKAFSEITDGVIWDRLRHLYLDLSVKLTDTQKMDLSACMPNCRIYYSKLNFPDPR